MFERLQDGSVLVVPLRTKPELVKLLRNHPTLVRPFWGTGIGNGDIPKADRAPGVFGWDCWDGPVGPGVGFLFPLQLEVFSDFMKTTQARGSSWSLSMELKNPCGSLPAQNIP